MPGDVHVVPLDHPYSGKQGEAGSDQSDYRLVDVMEGTLRDPEEEDDKEYADGPPFLGAHLSHGVEFNPQAFYSTFDLGMLLFLLHREEYVHTHQQADNQDDDTHRSYGYKPVGISEITGAKESGNQGDGQQVGA